MKASYPSVVSLPSGGGIHVFVRDNLSTPSFGLPSHAMVQHAGLSTGVTIDYKVNCPFNVCGMFMQNCKILFSRCWG